MSDPAPAMLQQLVTGPTLVSRVRWYDRVDSTNAEAARRAAAGAEAGLLVLADEQTAGRGRQGRAWQAPRGTSLLASLLLRPTDGHGPRPAALGLVPLLVGLAVLEACEPLVSGAQLSLKWPNDLLAEGRKCAGVLVEAPAPGVVVVGVGVDVDWRRVERPDELAAATSLSEVGRGPVDRWRLLPALVERLDRWLDRWIDDPSAVLPAYRERCATIGAEVRVTQVGGTEVTGRALRIADDGALVVETAPAEGASGERGRVVELRAGDVHHLRPR